MRRFWDALFSSKLSMIILSLFVAIIGVATFIEDKYDTATAKLLIYHAAWFEFLMLALVALFIFNTIKNKLFKWDKFPSLIFHLSFIVLILGGGITRYTGFEADMHILEGEEVQELYITKPFLQVGLPEDTLVYSSGNPLYFSQLQINDFQLEFDIKGNEKVALTYKDYIFNAEQVLIANAPDGEKIIEISLAEANDRKTIYVKDGETVDFGSVKLSFNNKKHHDAIQILYHSGKLSIISPYDIEQNILSARSGDIIRKDSLVEFKANHVYRTQGEKFLFVKLHEKAIVNFIASNDEQIKSDALILNVSCRGKSYEAALFIDHTHYIQKFKTFKFDDLHLELAYGPKRINLPFAIKLEKFTLYKYPGSNIPSASESEVTLIDKRENVRERHLIAKNKVLDYDGYRFFQTSYDDDEKGTILSVNYDYYGTRITYFGYFLMIVGALLILFSKKSHFSSLDSKIKEVRAKRKALMLTILLIVGFNSSGKAQHNIQNPISVEHADRFGHLMVQTYDGRFSSVHALASDVIHKISGKDHFDIKEKGSMKAMHIFLDMQVDPDFWKTQKIIVIRERALRDILGVSGKMASFNDFFDNRNAYRLEELAQKAFQKKASEQSTLDREIIKVTERVNIFLMTINGTLLKIFPVQSSMNNSWISWKDSLAFVPLRGELTMLNDDLQLAELNYSNMMRAYLISTLYARESDDYTIPNRILGYIHNIQRQLTPNELLPSESKVELEVFYDKSKIFDFLKYAYALLGITLLVLTLIENFKSKSGKIIHIAIKVCIALFIAVFMYQTFGMGLRWYLGGHAPWSNGYEVLLLVAWGGVLAGFYVIRYSKITLAATAILASIILMVAGLSYYDPQLTNLNPVLKSYWLIIHVAIITIGYGFLALSFIVGLINVMLCLAKPKHKLVLFSFVIQELTYINEKLVTIGMFLTAIGTFIGCVWANESWGTYWSWNAKQTWSFVIVLAYGIVLHFRLIPKMKSTLTFNIGSIISFGSVLMTFVGVNYYFTKGLHSYASDDPPVFPVWAWVAIISIFVLILAAVWKEKLKAKR